MDVFRQELRHDFRIFLLNGAQTEAIGWGCLHSKTLLAKVKAGRECAVM